MGENPSVWIKCSEVVTQADDQAIAVSRDLSKRIRQGCVPDFRLLVIFNNVLKHPIHSVSRGEEAIAYLRGDLPYDDRLKYPVPDLVLLDIKMPGIDGFDVLRWIRGQSEFSHLCVVMLTSSDEMRDVNQTYQLGANSFLVKPLDFWNAAELSGSLDLMLERTQH